MKLFSILLGCLLAISTTSSAFAGNVTPKIISGKGQSITFKCQNRGLIVTVVLKPNLKYNVTTNVSPPTNGNYIIASSSTYRLKTGGLKNNSIVKQAGTFYLVATPQEANAAKLAETDGAVVCQ